LARDLAIIGLLYWARAWFASNWLTYLIWVNVVGFFGWALFVVGHDCGHGTFSTSSLLNQICGHIAHTPLLVPFNGWQISHHKHHRYHNHIDKDESWKPLTKNLWDQMVPSGKFIRTSPLSLLMYPWYLLALPDHPLLSGSHFNPWSRLFAPDQRLRAGISSASVTLFFMSLFVFFKVGAIFWYFIVPYMIFTAWLSLVTLLQHTDPKGSYYSDSKWNYTKGAFTSFDRSFGALINHLHHDINTHLVHHFFFTAIPHYHLVEATEAVKTQLRDKYPYDETNIVKAIFNTLRGCCYIEETPNRGVFKYVEGQ